MSDLETEFDRDMWRIYKKAKKECNYTATRYLQMLGEHGGFKTAKRLLADSKLHYGFVELYMRNRLDLTVEALVLKEKYRGLFTREELKAAEKRLRDLDYSIKQINEKC